MAAMFIGSAGWNRGAKETGGLMPRKARSIRISEDMAWKSAPR